MERSLSWVERSELCFCLARLFDYPDKGLLDLFGEPRFSDMLTRCTLACGMETGDDCGISFKGTIDLEEMRREYSRLYLTPSQTLISPYGGVWKAEKRGEKPILFRNAECLDIERFLGACGVSVQCRERFAYDCISIELEALQFLSSLESGRGGLAADSKHPESSRFGKEGAYREFFLQHAGSWMVEFAERTLSYTRMSVYRFAAELLKRFSTLELSHFGRR